MTATDWIIIIGLVALGSKNVRCLIIFIVMVLAITWVLHSLFGPLH
jgi:hypothetical protein